MTTCKNRKGQTYYLKVGTTKTGKPRYYASTNPKKGENAEAMPEGYSFRENVNGQVSVGKPQPSQIERMSFRGMGGWIWIDSPAPLKKLAHKFIPLLDDTEKLFEEYY